MFRFNADGTAKCSYNAVQFITILFDTAIWQQQNLSQTSNSQQTPHTSPSRASYVSILQKNWQRFNGTALYFVVSNVFADYGN